MLNDIDLRTLAEMHGPERAVLSLYRGRGPEGEGVLRHREQRIRALLAGHDAELEHFDQNLALVRGWLDEHGKDGEPVAVFACWANDFVGGFPLSVEPPTLLPVGAAPYLRPLAELQEEYENFAVVLADNTAARIVFVTSAEAQEWNRLRGDVKNHVRKGGWSQQRYARRREKQLAHYAGDVAKDLDALAKEQPFDRLVLLGSDEATRAIEEALSNPMRERLVGREAVDLSAGDDAAMQEAWELFFEEERDDEQQLWRKIQDAYLAHGLAAVGADDVLAAALVGRVECMLVTRDAALQGTRCRDCDNVFAGERERCGACGSTSVFGVDLVDTLVRQLELTSGTTEFADPIPGLTEVGDVAALLRY